MKRDRIIDKKKYYLKNRIIILNKARIWRLKNKDIITKKQYIAYQKNKHIICEKKCIYYKNNKSVICKSKKDYYIKNKKQVLERMRQYYLQNKEKVLLHNKQWGQKHKDTISLTKELWRQQNRDKVKLYHKKSRDRIMSTPHGRLRGNVSSLIYHRLKDRRLCKNSKKTFDFLPYTVAELMQHLEKQFVPGMTWKNYGKWHLDHLKPDCLFNYTSVDDEEFQKCWALENLQPLFVQDNLKKGKKYDPNN